MSAPSRQRSYTWEDPSATQHAAAHLDGLGILHAVGRGELPEPPALHTLGIVPGEAVLGRASFSLEPAEYHLNSFGVVHGGVLVALMDAAMGCAAHSLLPQGVGYVTAELNARFHRPALLDGGTLSCVGEVERPGTTTLVVRAEIRDSSGRLVATSGCTCLARHP